MSSWDEKPIITKYTKKLLGIVDSNEKENSILGENSSEKPKEVELEPTKRRQNETKKSGLLNQYEYPYARKSSKTRENTTDSIVVCSKGGEKKNSLDQAPLSPKMSGLTAKKVPLPTESSRKHSQIERLQRLYEDEMLARKPVRFNSFDMFEDNIKFKKTPRDSLAVMNRYDFIDCIDSNSESSENIQNKKLNNPKLNDLAPSFNSKEFPSLDNLDEDEEVSENELDDYEDQIIAIHRFQVRLGPKLAAVASSTSTSTPIINNYEYKSPRLNNHLPPIVTASQPISSQIVVPVPIPVPDPRIDAPVSMRPSLYSINQPSLPNIIPTPPTNIPVQQNISAHSFQVRKRNVRFGHVIETDVNSLKSNSNESINSRKYKVPNLHMKPLKSILRNRPFTPGTTFTY